MALTDNLVSYWKLDESSGNAADSHGPNTLTNNDTVAFVSAKLNNGADFEQSNAEYLSIADASQTGLDFEGTDMTCSFWVKPESLPGVDTQNSMFSKTDGNDGYAMKIANLGGTHCVRFEIKDGGGGGTKTYNETLSTAAFTHLVFRFTESSKEMSVWVNGVEETPQTSAVSIGGSAAAFQIGDGEGAPSGAGFDGIIDEAGIWSRALSDSEIGELYNSGNALSYDDFASGPANLKTYNTNVAANIKTINTNPIANVKSLNTNV